MNWSFHQEVLLPFNGEWYLETKIWVPHVLIDTGVLVLLVDHFCYLLDVVEGEAPWWKRDPGQGDPGGASPLRRQLRVFSRLLFPSFPSSS